MAAGLPELVDPLSWAEAGHRLQGRLRVSGMSRLQASLYSVDEDAEVDIDLQGGIDEQGIRYLRGWVQGVLTVPCQRCLQAMALTVDSRVAVGLVNGHSQADDLPEPYEALVLDSRTIPLAKIVEDELLLALPIVAMHAEPDCHSRYQPDAVPEKQAQGEKPNPFAVLAQLKK